MNVHRIILLAGNDAAGDVEAVVWQGEAPRTSHLFAELDRLCLDHPERLFAVERLDSRGWTRYIWRGVGIREAAIEEEQRRREARTLHATGKRKGGSRS